MCAREKGNIKKLLKKFKILTEKIDIALLIIFIYFEKYI